MKRRSTAAVLALLTCGGLLYACTDELPTDDATADPPADFIFRGGPVLTIEDGTAEALAVAGTEIVAVGTEASVMEHARADTRVVELNGQALVPGFVDGHSHMIKSAERQGLTRAEAADQALRYGLTTIAELANGQHVLDAFFALEDAGDLRLRLVAYAAYNASHPDENGRSIYRGTWYPDNGPIRGDDRLVHVPGIKVFVDGAFSNDRGCYAMTDPYPEAYRADPNYSCYGDRGALFLGAGELADIIEGAENAGFQVAMHVIGDRGLDTALAALEEVRERTGNASPRHQLHHNDFMRTDQFDRYRELDVPYSVRGYHHTCSEDIFPYFFGDRYVWYANRFALAVDGGRAFIETDFGYRQNPDDDRFFNRPIDPLVILWAMATHRENRQGTICDPEPWLAAHPVPIETGLRMFTLNGAYAHGMDHRIGSLRVGKLADLVILSGDPTAGSADDLLGLHVVMTMVGGEVEYCAGDCPVP